MDVRENLGHLRWDQILPPAVDKQFGSLPLLTDEAFQALLPAFLFHALRDPSPENKILEWLLYALCGAYEEDGMTIEPEDALRKRAAGFTAAQRAAVRAFLSFAFPQPELAFHHDAISRAIQTIWPT